MPEEIMIIVIVAILAGTVSSIVRSIMGVAKARAHTPVPEGSSLTTSELKRMLQAAVQDGNARMEERFDLLEKRIDRLEHTPAALSPAEGRIDARLLDDEEITGEAAPARRARTT